MTSIPITPYSRRQPARLVGEDTGSTADARSAVDHDDMGVGSMGCFHLEHQSMLYGPEGPSRLAYHVQGRGEESRPRSLDVYTVDALAF